MQGKRRALAGCLFAFSVFGGVILAIFCAVEYRKVNSYVTVRCFIRSAQLKTSYGPGNRPFSQVVYNVTVYESDGRTVTTTIWLPVANNGALIVINTLPSYRPNQTYPCYHRQPPYNPLDVQFDRPSKARAIGFLGGCIACFLLCALMASYVCYRWACRREKVNRTSHPPAGIEMADVQQYSVDLPPPSYEEATGQTIGRPASNTTRL